jgi:glutathione S-transferase
MLMLHHLNDSRSQRILWLLEELATPYEMVSYQRNPQTRLAPPELAKIHPLGKSPIIVDGDVKIAESGAIVDYIIRRYGKGAMMPAPDSADYEAYNEWLHYSEGSAMLPLMLNLCLAVEGGRRSPASAHRQRTRQPSRLRRRRAEGPRILRRPIADRRRHPDELCRRDGEDLRQARTVSEPVRVAVARARAACVPALGGEGRGVPVRQVAWAGTFYRQRRPVGAGAASGTGGVVIRYPNHILHKIQADTASAWPVPRNMLIGLLFRPPLQDRPQPRLTGCGG